MPNNRRTKVQFPVYRYTITVIESRNLVRTGKRLGVDLSDCSGAFIHNPPLDCWLVFELNPSESTIAHEASHAIRAMFKAVGIRSDDETFAYHLGHLVGLPTQVFEIGDYGRTRHLGQPCFCGTA